MLIKCVKCGESVNVEMTSHEGRYTCPKCGLKNYIKKDNKGIVYSIDDNLHSLGSMLPFERKADKMINFLNKGIRLLNKFLSISLKTRVAIAVVFALLIFTPILCYWIAKPCAIEKTVAYSRMQQQWESFRSANPYNVQIVGIQAYEDGSFNVLLSEPGERVSEVALNRFLKDYNCAFSTFKQKIGIDGWMKDAVISINGLSEKKIAKFKHDLFLFLYGTAYKAEFVDLASNPSHIAYSESDLNYQITSEELNKWFIEDGELLINIDDSTSINTLDEILRLEVMNSLYHSQQPGFVVWVLKRNVAHPEKDFCMNARRFGLDSDLILGAISDDDKVAIIARERMASIYELSPLRQETILMLAATDKTELSQSYERNNLFAGKLADGKDFAPILLSDELWHTEYGNLLNVTDQMLKSWSENGGIEYIAFDYPKPFDWAFSDGALADLKASTLTYNWNTAGAGYIVENESGLNVYAVNRTGSLPVSYIPGETDEISDSDPIYLAEEKAYDFFSGLHNAELVKVVQYASLYQIFTNFNVDAVSYVKPKSLPTTMELDAKLERVLTKICNYHVRSNQVDEALQQAMKEAGLMSTMDSPSKDKYNDSQVSTIKDYFATTKRNNLISSLTRYYDKEFEGNSSDEIENAINELEAKINKDLTLLEIGVILNLLDADEESRIRSSFNEKLKLIKDFDKENQTIGHLMASVRCVDENFQENANVFLSKIDTINSLIYDNRNAKINGDGVAFLNVVSHYINNPRKINYEAIHDAIECERNFGDELYCQYIAWGLSKYTEELREYAKIFDICSLDQAYKSYLSENARKSLYWQKCPTVVLSWNSEDSIMSVGGHNLDSKITPVRINKSLKPGEYKIKVENGRKIIEVASVDKGHVTPSFLRKVERTNLSHEGTFDKTISRVRERNEVISSSVDRTERGFNKGHVVIEKKEGVFFVGEKRVSTVDELFGEVANNIDNGDGMPFKEIEFRQVSERDMLAIIDGMKEVRLSRGEALRSIPNKAFDVSKAEIETLPNGNSKVRIPISAEEVYKYQAGINQASLGGGANVNLSFWQKVQRFFIEFEMPSSKVASFMKMLKELLKDPFGVWDNFRFHRELKSIKIESTDCVDTYNMMVAELYWLKDNGVLEFVEKEVA